MNKLIYKILTVVILVIFAFSIFLWYSKPNQTSSQTTVGENYNDDLPPGNGQNSAGSETINPNNPTPTNPTPVTATKTPSSTNTSSKYKDGTYNITSNYGTPAGTESLGVSLTIKNDIVVDANITNMAKDRTSKNFQNRFISGYKAQVVGKSVDSVNLGAVSGSSLTPNGFNSALATIKQQALN